MTRAVRLLSPLPLFDESSLLAACAHHSDPISAIHATHLWKALLKAELDEHHPGYVARMNSRMGSRATSRANSRTASRRTSVDHTAEESKSDDGQCASEPSASGSASSPRSSAIAEGDESVVDEEEDSDARARRFELERSIRAKLEAEDDALLAGLTVFPRSRFNPSSAELADPSSPLHTKVVTSDLVSRLPGRMYPLLAERFSYLTSRLQSHKTSADGSTTKLLIRLQDGQHIESVIMRHKQKDVATGNVEQRITLCVSSQVGCAMGCTFCATGTMGMRGNCMMGEIIEQLIIANRFDKIRNIVCQSNTHAMSVGCMPFAGRFSFVLALCLSVFLSHGHG
jgi:hypothetical protein